MYFSFLKTYILHFLKHCFIFRGVIGKQGYQCQGKRKSTGEQFEYMYYIIKCLIKISYLNIICTVLRIQHKMIKVCLTEDTVFTVSHRKIFQNCWSQAAYMRQGHSSRSSVSPDAHPTKAGISAGVGFFIFHFLLFKIVNSLFCLRFFV